MCTGWLDSRGLWSRPSWRPLACLGRSLRRVILPPPDGCSDCDFCPVDPEKIAFSDHFQNDVLWVPQNCSEYQSCGIECQPEEQVDIDVLARAVELGDWLAVGQSLERYGRVSYSAQRNAMVVGGCRSSIAAVLPLPNDAAVMAAVALRAYRAAQRRALTVTALLAEAAT